MLSLVEVSDCAEDVVCVEEGEVSAQRVVRGTGADQSPLRRQQVSLLQVSDATGERHHRPFFADVREDDDGRFC